MPNIAHAVTWGLALGCNEFSCCASRLTVGAPRKEDNDALSVSMIAFHGKHLDGALPFWLPHGSGGHLGSEPEGGRDLFLLLPLLSLNLSFK